MSNMNELLTSIILYCLISYILNMPHLFAGLIFAVIGSQISTLLPYNYKNSLTILLILGAFIIINPLIFTPLIIGFIASITISLLSKNGCKLLYPFKDTTFTGPNNYLENDTKGDYAATTFLVVLAVLSIIFSVYGVTIVDDISQNNDLTTYFHSNKEEENSTQGSVQYININPAECLNMNITTIKTDNTTTTLISEYK